MRLGAALLALLLVAPASLSGQTAGPPLALEAKIPLGAVSGRIDHLAIDLKRQLLFVANAGDGSVRVLRGEDLAQIGRIELGEDADNVRVDAPHQRVLVGYGKGGLAIIDSTSRAKSGDIRLSGHPESFQFAENGTQIFVNVPDFREIAIVDQPPGAVRTVPNGGLRANFPMAIDPEAHRALAVFRSPPTLLALTSPEGRVAAKLTTCGDADDVFVDARRRRIYVSCGEGVVDVIEPREGGYSRMAQVSTVAGARTALFVPEFDRLFVAVRAHGAEPAAIWVFRPAP